MPAAHLDRAWTEVPPGFRLSGPRGMIRHSPEGLAMAGQIESMVRTTCPRDCYDSCGIVAERGEDGQVRRIIGDPGHHMARGKLCRKCALAYNGAWRDPGLRLATPLKRSGAKGEGRFSPVTWDEAFRDIAARLKAIAATDSAASIYHTHYTGTCAILGGTFPMRFFNRLGASEVDPDTVCNKAAHAALGYTFGDSLTGFDPDTLKDARAVLVWGANPSAAGPHVDEHWLGSGDAPVIVIDPIAHATARRADLHLQLRPGSDAALAFGMLHLSLARGFIDEALLAKATLGWDEVQDDIQSATPERTAALTGLQAADIERAVELYAPGPSLMWLGQGLQRQPMGGNAYRAAALLAVATGNIATPGAGVLFLNGAGTRGAHLDYVAAPHLAKAAPAPVSQMDLADHLGDAARTAALFCWNNNIAASNPDQARLIHALKREDLFHVCVELFHTDTTAFADYVLPAASFLEYDDLLFPYFNNTVSALAQVQPAPGEALPNAEIFRRLAGAMGFDEPELFESDRAVIDHVLAASAAGIGFDVLKEIGTKKVFDVPRVQFADLRFNTPSGKIEIASAAAAAAGCWRSPRPHADPPAGQDRVRVLSPASEWTLNSSYGNDPQIRRRLGRQSALINPDDAAERHIADGQTVILRNATGTLRLAAKLSAETLPGVVVVHKGNWPQFEAESGGNVNVLNPGVKTDMGESSSVHGIEAELVVG